MLCHKVLALMPRFLAARLRLCAHFSSSAWMISLSRISRHSLRLPRSSARPSGRGGRFFRRAVPPGKAAPAWRADRQAVFPAVPRRTVCRSRAGSSRAARRPARARCRARPRHGEKVLCAPCSALPECVAPAVGFPPAARGRGGLIRDQSGSGPDRTSFIRYFQEGL